ncbi:galectin-8-like isoform X1 [Platichthys flesus]|uniref:galectin-8-like isoform X1 n=1 Tax=Platichthys flesus TaxID=8260 RepID=UPI002DB8EBFA|nr:galectin-8-like isoform X1 [Platichthys flesus]
MSKSNLRQTFLKPLIPFAGTILGGLVPGEMVLIQGSVPSGADRFQVDFTCGSSVHPRADVAFHFNPRFQKSPCIVCNSLQGERWGREQILNHMPFATGGAFELIVLVLKDKFKVAVNGVHVLEYKHRQDLDRVDTLCVSGKVSAEVVGIAPPNTVSPSSATLSHVTRQLIFSSSGNLSVPFRGDLGDGLGVGRSITITGETHPNALSFCVNLGTSSGSDLALHLNPRLKRRRLVRNSFLSESWGPEETALDSFPFAAGQYFEMIIRCEPQQFKVAVNGVHQLDYKHRVQELRSINQVEVQGDVTLLDVNIF